MQNKSFKTGIPVTTPAVIVKRKGNIILFVDANSE